VWYKRSQVLVRKLQKAGVPFDDYLLSMTTLMEGKHAFLNVEVHALEERAVLRHNHPEMAEVRSKESKLRSNPNPPCRPHVPTLVSKTYLPACSRVSRARTRRTCTSLTRKIGEKRLHQRRPLTTTTTTVD
jgi:hypothetical protein